MKRNVIDNSYLVGCALLILLAVILALSSCTIAPRYVTSDTVGIVDNHSDAGIVSWAKNGAFVRLGYVQNYRYLVSKYGSKLTPPVTKPLPVIQANDGLYYVGDSILVQYAQLTGIEINGQ